MKKKTYLVFELLMAVALIGLNISFLSNNATGTVLFKSAASLFFVLAGFCGYIKNVENKLFSRLMLYGYICCMAGDIFLALDSSGILFVFGVASFAGAHILYSVAFCKVSPVKKTDIPLMLVLFAGLVMLLCLGNFDFQGLFPVLIIYSAIISFMVIKALSLLRCQNNKLSGVKLVIAGSILFLVSDIVLLFWLFGIGAAKEVQCVNWVLYYTAQGCLAAALNTNP